jgi:ABC-type multidrug transport system fused ATPase/permease subunit
MTASRSESDSDIEKGTLLAPTAITLSWSELSFEINGRTILSDVSGELKSGQLLAVMGPSGASPSTKASPIYLTIISSGAGKSTFLDVR